MSNLVISDLLELENIDGQELNKLHGGGHQTADALVGFAGSADNNGNIAGAGATIDDPRGVYIQAGFSYTNGYAPVRPFAGVFA